MDRLQHFKQKELSNIVEKACQERFLGGRSIAQPFGQPLAAEGAHRCVLPQVAQIRADEPILRTVLLLLRREMNDIDQWSLGKLYGLTEKTQRSYAEFEFHTIIHDIHDFCAVTLSAMYLDMVKDRLYCGETNSHERRSTQTALYHLMDTLVKLIAPILVFTAEDAYTYFNNSQKKKAFIWNLFQICRPNGKIHP